MRKKKDEKPLQFHRIEHPRIYGEDEIALSNAKVNIHIRLDADILQYFKNLAQQEGGKYQSLINQHLRQTVFGEQNIENRLQRVEEVLGIADTQANPNPELVKSLWKFVKEDLELEKRLGKYQHKHHLTPAEKAEIKRTQARSINEKARLMKILEKYRTVANS